MVVPAALSAADGLAVVAVTAVGLAAVLIVLIAGCVKKERKRNTTGISPGLRCESTSASAVEARDTTLHSSGREPLGGHTGTTLERLIPGGALPEVVQIMLDDERQSDDTKCGGVLRQQYREATEWLLDALCHAHEDARIMQAARRLLAHRSFTYNMDWADACFTKVLKPGLKKRLEELASQLKAKFASQRPDKALSDDALNSALQGCTVPISGATSKHPDITQLEVLPCDPSGEFINWHKPWTYPEDVYGHALLMMAAILNDKFSERVASVVDKLNVTSTCVAQHMPAPTKSFARVRNKATADYRYRSRPVNQHSLDVVRCLVSGDSTSCLRALVSSLSAEFGGVKKIKNFFTAPKKVRAERFHLVSIMLTVVVDSGTSVGDLVHQQTSRISMDKYVAARDPGVPQHVWTTTTSLARKMLTSEALARIPARVLGEVQLMLADHVAFRHMMHEVYKAFRAESDTELHDDFARSGESWLDEKPLTIAHAAMLGNLPEVERFLRDGFDADQTDVLWRVPPLISAARGGFIDVVKVLLDAGASPDITMAGGHTALTKAAQNGRTAVAQMLIDSGADLSRTATMSDGTKGTAADFAAQQGYRDIVNLLTSSS